LRYRIEEGALEGVYVFLEYSNELGNIVYKPLPQVGFRNRTTLAYRYYLIAEVPDKISLEQEGLDLDDQVTFLGCDFKTAQESLRAGDISPRFVPFDSSNVKNGMLSSEVTGVIDEIICRAIAKIAFNYLAYWEGADFVLQNAFDPIRRYIKDGEKGLEPFLSIGNQGIVSDDPGREAVIHIVTVNWSQDGSSLISQVSLFNILSYKVRLVKDYLGERRKIRRGHYFNIGDQGIYELTAK
jgi:hypothetical protein